MVNTTGLIYSLFDVSTSIAAGVDDLPCFPTFYFYNPYSNIKFPYTCNFLILVKIQLTLVDVLNIQEVMYTNNMCVSVTYISAKVNNKRGECLTPYRPVIDDCAEVKRLPFRVTYRLASIFSHLTTKTIPDTRACIQCPSSPRRALLCCVKKCGC